MTHEYYMKQALREAQKAFEADEVPIGAVVVQDGKILARAFNQVEMLNDPTAHAEIIALTSAFNFLGSKYLSEASLYVTVEPCIMCAGAMYWSKLGSVIFGAYDDKNGYRRTCTPAIGVEGIAQVKSPFHPKTVLVPGVLADECAALMKEFFRKRR